MSSLPFVIAFNGPPKIGKGWICEQLMKILPIPSRKLSFAEPLREYCFYKSHWTDRSPEGYTHYKETRFYSEDLGEWETGREFLIRIGNGMREKDIHHWSRRLTKSQDYLSAANEIVLVDDLGFVDEQIWLHDNAAACATITMAPTQYSPGMQWENDSRFCLAPINGFRSWNSDQTLLSFKRRLQNAQPYLEGNPSNRLNWFRIVMAGPMGEQTNSEYVRSLLSNDSGLSVAVEEHGEPAPIPSVGTHQSD